MPPGFPVKLGRLLAKEALGYVLCVLSFADVPVFPTVTATVTLQHYESQEFPPSKFVVPEGYTKVRLTGSAWL